MLSVQMKLNRIVQHPKGLSSLMFVLVFIQHYRSTFWTLRIFSFAHQVDTEKIHRSCFHFLSDSSLVARPLPAASLLFGNFPKLEQVLK